MDYKIKLKSFEGPLDLLLNLIEEAEIDIYDIPINLITEQYMAYIYQMESLNMDIASDFILMASTLLQIKSKMLLPEDPDDKEDEEDTIDPREELVLQLTAYKQYKQAAEKLREYEEYGLRAYYKPKEDLSLFIEEEPKAELQPMNLNLILRSINKIISQKSLEDNIDLHQIQKDKYSVEECSDKIINILEYKKDISFTSLLSKKTNTSEIITYFLSVLELTKLQLILVRQDKDFSDLVISKNEIGEF